MESYIIQYLFFSIWLISFVIMSSRFIQSVVNSRISTWYFNVLGLMSLIMTFSPCHYISDIAFILRKALDFFFFVFLSCYGHFLYFLINFKIFFIIYLLFPNNIILQRLFVFRSNCYETPKHCLNLY